MSRPQTRQRQRQGQRQAAAGAEVPALDGLRLGSLLGSFEFAGVLGLVKGQRLRFAPRLRRP